MHPPAQARRRSDAYPRTLKVQLAPAVGTQVRAHTAAESNSGSATGTLGEFGLPPALTELQVLEEVAAEVVMVSCIGVWCCFRGGALASKWALVWFFCEGHAGVRYAGNGIMVMQTSDMHTGEADMM